MRANCPSRPQKAACAINDATAGESTRPSLGESVMEREGFSRASCAMEREAFLGAEARSAKAAAERALCPLFDSAPGSGCTLKV